MELVISSEKSDKTVIEVLYICPKCRNRYVAERIVVKKNGFCLKLERTVFSQGAR